MAPENSHCIDQEGIGTSGTWIYHTNNDQWVMGAVFMTHWSNSKIKNSVIRTLMLQSTTKRTLFKKHAYGGYKRAKYNSEHTKNC